MKLFEKRKAKKHSEETQKRNMRHGIYSATAVEHTYVKGGVRDGGLGNAQKLTVLQMLRDQEK